MSPQTLMSIWFLISVDVRSQMEPLISWMAFAPWCRLKKVMPFISHKSWKLPKMHGSTITMYDSSRCADTNLPSDRSHDVWPIASMMCWCLERCSQGFRRSPSRFLMRLTWLASLMMTPSPSGCMMDFGRWSYSSFKRWKQRCFPSAMAISMSRSVVLRGPLMVRCIKLMPSGNADAL